MGELDGAASGARGVTGVIGVTGFDEMYTESRRPAPQISEASPAHWELQPEGGAIIEPVEKLFPQ
jgi:hypothetical protein